MAFHTREKIVNAARDHFFSAGLKNSRIDTLAEAAGISKKTIYNHFSSKEELFQEALQLDTQLWMEEAQRISADPGLTFGEKASRLLEHAVERLRSQGSLFTEEESSPMEESRRRNERTFNREWTDILRLLLEEGMERGYIHGDINPLRSACLIISMIRGVSDMLEISILPDPPEQLFREAVRIMRGGILTGLGEQSLQIEP